MIRLDVFRYFGPFQPQLHLLISTWKPNMPTFGSKTIFEIPICRFHFGFRECITSKNGFKNRNALSWPAPKPSDEA